MKGLEDRLRERAAAVEERLDELETTVEARREGDDAGFTDEERTEYEALVEELKTIRSDLKRLDERRAASVADWRARRGTDEPTPPEDPAYDGARVTSTGDDPGGPFGSLGEQLQAIANASRGDVDERLYQVAGPTGGSANVGRDAGFLIQDQFAGQLFDAGLEAAELAPRCQTIPIGANADRLSYWYPEKYDRRTGYRWGGVQIYWRAEADTVTAKKPALSEGELKLEELMALAYATERQLEDVTQLEAVYTSAFSEEFAWMLDDAILTGSGSGRPLGILNSNSLVTIAVETGQTATDPVLAENIIKMWGRMPQRFRGDAIWAVNQEIEDYLPSLQIGTGTSGQLVYMPPGGLTGSAYATLQGRPVIPVEQCPALNSVGDICLMSLSQYVLIRKGGLRGSTSMHVRFIYDERTFKWTMRVNGMPKLRTSITPAKATAGRKLSAFVTLAARS
jgi:HK97 family phage major capsid protein